MQKIVETKKSTRNMHVNEPNTQISINAPHEQTKFATETGSKWT